MQTPSPYQTLKIAIATCPLREIYKLLKQHQPMQNRSAIYHHQFRRLDKLAKPHNNTKEDIEVATPIATQYLAHTNELARSEENQHIRGYKLSQALHRRRIKMFSSFFELDQDVVEAARVRKDLISTLIAAVTSSMSPEA